MIDSLSKNRRYISTTYTNHPGGIINPAGVLATPSITGGSRMVTNMPFMTPRKTALYATNERSLNSEAPSLDPNNSAAMAKTYASMSVHKAATILGSAN